MVNSGVDSNKDVYPILVDSSGKQYVIIDGSVTVIQPTAANLKATVVGTVTAEQANEANLKATVSIEEVNPTSWHGKVYQDTAALLKATVTQLAKDRTVTGTVTANPTPLSTLLHGAITLTDADTVYKLPASEQSGRLILVIYNISDTTVYIGGSGVATTDGMPLASTKYMVVPASANVYAVCGSAGKILRLLECK